MDNSAVGLNLVGRPLYVLTAMLLLAFAAVIAMPFNITGIVQSFGVSNSTAGLVASTELLAISISSLYVAQIAGRMPARLIYVIGIFAILAANALTIMASSVEPLVLLRAIAGIGGGGVTAMVMFTAGQSRNPEKTFGIINSFVGIMGTLMALILPQALLLYHVTDPQWHLRAADGLYGVYLVAAIVALLLIRWVPIPLASIATPGETAAKRPSARAPIAGWVALFGLGMVFFGHGSLGIYIVELGLSTGLSSQAIGNTFAVASLLGIAGPLIGGYIGANFKAALPITILLAATVLLALLLANTTSALWYYILAPLYSIAPMTVLPLALGVLARIDRTGRLTGSYPAFVTLGGAAAPVVGGALRDFSGGFSMTGWFVGICVIAGGLLMIRAVTAADAGRSEMAAEPATS